MEKLMEQKRKLDEKVRFLSSKINESEALIASCRVLAQSDVVTRSAEIKTAFCALKEGSVKDSLIMLVDTAIGYHPDPDGFEEELRSMRKTLDDAKTEWKQSSVVREENGCLEFEDLEGEDDEVFVKREKSLTALRYLIDMEYSLLFIRSSNSNLFDDLTGNIDPLIVSIYNNTTNCQGVLDQEVDKLNNLMQIASTESELVVWRRNEFYVETDSFRASML
jgi:hypothetical protein